MPADEISISDTTTPTMTSAPPTRNPDSTVGIAAGITTRVMSWLSVAPMLRAASSNCGSMVWIPAAVAPMGGRKAVEGGKRIFESGADAEPHREHRIEDHQRHRVETLYHRHDQ